MTARRLDSGWLTITHRAAPGDTLVATAFLRDLERAHPGRFRVYPNLAFAPLIDGNPYVQFSGRPKNSQSLKLCYGRVLRDGVNRTIHFLQSFHENFEEQTGIRVPLTDPKPDLHFLPQEEKPLVSGRYWVINAGGKADFTTKLWEHDKYQRTVDLLTAHGIRCVQVGMLRGSKPAHIHKPLKNVLNLLDQTNLRQLMQLVRDSDGVISGVTMLMHMAAALERPAIVVAGGREPWYWEAYVRENKGLGAQAHTLKHPHTYLHSIGLLDCCARNGCWKCHVYDPAVAHSARQLCTKPVQIGDKYYPLCLHIIEPEHILKAVMDRYEDRSLPPLEMLRPLPELLTNLQTPPEAVPPPTTTVARTFRPNRPVPQNRIVTPIGPRLVSTTRHAPPEQVRPPVNSAVWDNPILGGKVTMFVLMYGSYIDQHEKCLNAILQTVPKERRDLRIGSNELCDDTVALIGGKVAQGEVTLHYRNATNDCKYPVMRRMFHDAQNPITTPYLIWMDDDTYCDRDLQWFDKLGECIVDHHPRGARMFGPPFSYHLQPSQQRWVGLSEWYKRSRRPWSNRAGKESPNEAHVPFASGSFWALNTAAMRECDIPDARLNHNGGDYMIGAQLWQGRHGFQGFSAGKSIVNWSAEKRRGLSEKHAGM